jgi:hypothetical protein
VDIVGTRRNARTLNALNLILCVCGGGGIKMNISLQATLFLGDINTGTWPSRLGESQMRQ